MSRQGSGMMLWAGDRFLLLRRSAKVPEPGIWNLPGGQVDRGETPYQTAVRETEEEAGATPPHKVVGEHVSRTPQGVYTAFLAQIDRPFKPDINWESDAWVWVTGNEARDLPLHPGLRRLLDETGAA